MTPPEVAYQLYHALVSSGHANWCPALSRADGSCTCGRTAALLAYEAERESAERPVLSLAGRPTREVRRPGRPSSRAQPLARRGGRRG